MKDESTVTESTPTGSTETGSTGSGPSPESTRPRNAKGHKSSCVCTLCKRIQARIARGEGKWIDSVNQKKIETAIKRSQRQTPKQSRRANSTTEKVAASVETQVRMGLKPDLRLTAKVAGIAPQTLSNRGGVKGSSEFVQGALSRAGIDDTKLAEVAAAGLDAAAQRIVTDREGNIVDVINVPDWKARHSFWSDLLRVKRILGGDAETGGGSGGLIIITPDNAKVLPGHAPTCSCDGCLRAWEEKTAHLRRAAMKEMAITAGIVNSERQDSRQDPRAKNAIDADVIDVDAEEEDEIEYDDFGPLE